MASKKGSARKRAKKVETKRVRKDPARPWVVVYTEDVEDEGGGDHYADSYTTRAEAITGAQEQARDGNIAWIAVVTDELRPTVKRQCFLRAARNDLTKERDTPLRVAPTTSPPLMSDH